MSILEICQWLQDTSWGTQIRESVWVFPILEGTHLLGITVSAGTLLVLDLRLAGVLFMKERVTAVSRAVLPMSVVGFALMFLTGAFLFLCQAVKAWTSVWFKAKVVFLLLAGINALIFELTQRKTVPQWDVDVKPPLRARLAGMLGIALWACVILAGRTMAYNF